MKCCMKPMYLLHPVEFLAVQVMAYIRVSLCSTEQKFEEAINRIKESVNYINNMFDKVTIVGVGLIGGSLALAMKEKGFAKK